jgi:hypothetical protein
MIETIKKHIDRKRTEVPEYGLLYFDHLQGEFSLEVDSINEPDKRICLDIQTKRNEGLLTWNEIYTYQLILLKYQDFETLKSKIISLRIKYQSLVDIADYNSYIALRAVDLPRITNSDEYTVKLRADYKYLLDEFYLRYAYTSTREDFRTRLLRYGALLTLCFFLLSAVFIIIPFLDYFKGYSGYRLLITFSTLIAVVFTGVMGAFVSMQQRLQNVPHHADPIYSLSLLTHGWLSIFLSPISGAIFAALLYLFFTGGLLEGTIFPKMITPATNSDEAPTIMELTNFVIGTGPKSGKDFALLLIWSFIAGFAERFVPDTIMRLISQKKNTEAAST